MVRSAIVFIMIIITIMMLMMIMVLQCTAVRGSGGVEHSASSTPVLLSLRLGFSLIWPWYEHTYHHHFHQQCNAIIKLGSLCESLEVLEIPVQSWGVQGNPKKSWEFLRIPGDEIMTM